MRNRRGPKTEPCGTPTVNGSGFEREPSIFTWNTLLLRYEISSLIARRLKP